MAAVPSVVNLINNHLSTMDKEKDRESVVPEAYNDEDNLVGKNGAYLIFGIDGYVQIYKKFWPFRFLKMTNFVLLLLLAIGTSVTYSYSIWWSNYGESILYERPFRIYESYAISLWILFLFSFCSLIVHRFAKSTFFAGVFSLMDICFYAINIVILCFSNILFSTKSVAEFLWFWPKLANFNYTFEGYVDLTESNEDYKQSQLPYYQPHYYFDSDNNVWPNGIKDQVDRRKKELLLNLLINPTSAVLSGIAIIINILMIFILYKRMRKSNLFASGLNNYKLLFPNCSEIEQKYSNHYPFGMIKTFLWLSPTILIFGILCFPPLNNSSIKPYILPSIIYFIHWLLYYCTIHLNKDVKRIDFICLKNLFYLDLFISLFFAILFITRYISERYFESKLFLLASILYGSYFLILSFIYWKNIDRESFKSFNFEFPVSIKINIEINRKPITDDKKDNENEKIVEVKDDEKEKNNEVKV